MNKDNSKFFKYTETLWHQRKSQKIKSQELLGDGEFPLSAFT